MTFSSRHAIATHILLMLGCCQDGRACSEDIAKSVNTNAVVIRRLLAKLKDAGLVGVQKGVEGGYFLLRKPSQINLWDVLTAVEDPPYFAVHNTPPNPDCEVGACVGNLLEQIYEDAESALETSLKKVSLCGLIDCVGEEPL